MIRPCDGCVTNVVCGLIGCMTERHQAAALERRREEEQRRFQDAMVQMRLNIKRMTPQLQMALGALGVAGMAAAKQFREAAEKMQHDQMVQRILDRDEANRARWWFCECHAYIGSQQEAFDDLHEAWEELMRVIRNSTPGALVWRALNWTCEKIVWFLGLYGFK